MNSRQARSTLDTSGLPHGSVRIHPKSPVPPRSRPATSSDATMVNAVTRLGNEMIIVLKV